MAGHEDESGAFGLEEYIQIEQAGSSDDPALFKDKTGKKVTLLGSKKGFLNQFSSKNFQNLVSESSEDSYTSNSDSFSEGDSDDEDDEEEESSSDSDSEDEIDYLV